MDEPAAEKRPTPELESLAPEFLTPQHGVYFEILKRAIEEQPGVRNIALAGAYGSGKSSVLRKVATHFEGRVVEVSLLTLGKKPEPVPPGANSNPAATTATNRIQKEIVKQLLYRQSPTQAPESRFRRIARFRLGHEIGIAVLLGVLTLALLVAAGLDVSALKHFGITLPVPPPWLRTTLSYVAVVAAVSLVVLVTRMLLHGRLGIEKVAAGPATITLPPRSSTFFDEYLDEIIYFFETNRKLDIVVLEDLDRFDDPHIFESLRSLNLLLNAAHQLRRRNIRFVYAVKDSVFEKLGRDEVVAAADAARAELVRANRTKFFELVVPMVPFITHKNARDLMHAQLDLRGHNLSKDLIDLAARHVADMRLIHNIVNEYEVFKNRLIEVAQPVPGLDPERLFAMVLFKNAHAGDFEAIRLGTSSLDRLYETWRSLVSANLDNIRREEARLIVRIEAQEAANEHAARLGTRFRQVVTTLASAPRGGVLPSDQIVVGNSVVDDTTLKSAKLWRDIVAGKQPVSLTTHRTGYSSYGAWVLETSALESLLGLTLDSAAWSTPSIERDRATISRNRANAGFLRHHTWQELVDRPHFTYATGDEQPQSGHSEEKEAPGEPARSFRGWIEHLLPSPLAVDLVANGWINSYFSLHVSSFYGQLIRPDAMTYVMRNVDHNTADPYFVLDANDVEAILRDQGSSVLGERSMYNVSILDHLLANEPDKAAVVARRLAGGGTDELAFIDIYLTTGRAKHELVEHLAPTFKSVFAYVVDEAPIEREDRAGLLDIAIAHRSTGTDYSFTDSLRTFVEANYHSMPSLNDDELGQAAAGTIEFIVEAGAELVDVTALSAAACEALAATRAFKLTGPNLERLANDEDVALDRLEKMSGELFPYAIERLDQYIEAHGQSPNTTWTVDDPKSFVGILNASASWQEADYEWLVKGANPDCAVEDLDEVPELAWHAMAEGRRFPATFENVATYVERKGRVDSHLATLLQATGEIAEVDAEESARRDLALAIVNAGAVITDPAHRIKLAQSLKPGALPTASILPEPGRLVGGLISSGLIADDANAFDARLMVDWPTQEYAITQSEGFVEIAGPETIPVAHIAPLMRSTTVTSAVQAKVADLIRDFGGGVPNDAFQAVADCLLRSRIRLDASHIEIVLEGGASTTSVLELLAKAGEQVPIDDLRQSLRALGEPYSIVADKGKRRPTLPDTTANRAILKRLRDVGIVSEFPPRKGCLAVSLKQV